MSSGSNMRNNPSGTSDLGRAADLRLVHPPRRADPPRKQLTRPGQPLGGATDPRWVLAVRTAEVLQGTILPAEARDKLVRLGRVMGLTTFDANLVIAIVQDQARRGHTAAYCPTAGEDQLRMVPLGRKGSLTTWTGGRLWQVVTMVLAIVGLEAGLMIWWCR